MGNATAVNVANTSIAGGAPPPRLRAVPPHVGRRHAEEHSPAKFSCFWIKEIWVPEGQGYTVTRPNGGLHQRSVNDDHQARAELAQKTLRSVNEIVGLAGAVWALHAGRGIVPIDRMRLKRLQWSLTATFLHFHPSESCNAGGKLFPNTFLNGLPTLTV